jgi:plastocyanin
VLATGVEAYGIARHRLLYVAGMVNGMGDPTGARFDGNNFVPHVLAIVKGSTVKWLNDDSVKHNVFSPEGAYDLGSWSHGESRTHTFTKPGVYTQLCRLHPEMEGFVHVLDTPYFAVTGDDGHFEIKDVPPGTYTLHVWSDKLKGMTKKITVDGGKPTTVDVTLTK